MLPLKWFRLSRVALELALNGGWQRPFVAASTSGDVTVNGSAAFTALVPRHNGEWQFRLLLLPSRDSPVGDSVRLCCFNVVKRYGGWQRRVLSL